jgi:AcrR family transcriptional regulator
VFFKDHEIQNKEGADVQEFGALKTKSKLKIKGPKTQTADRRIVRTRDRLGDALIALMHEKNFEVIIVQDVLDRAGVGRTTFYAHYSDKDDLFFSDVEEFLQLVAGALKEKGDTSKRLFPVEGFLVHIRDQRQLYAALVKSGKVHDFRALGLGLFARSIEERLQAAGGNLNASSLSAYAYALAGGLFSLLDWWIDKGMKADPAEVDRLFHRLAWKGLS